jgi:hypothetical protein
VKDQDRRSARLRYTATGALAAIVVVGAIAGTAALAAKPPVHAPRHVVMANCDATKTPGSKVPDKTGTPEPPANPQAFLNDIRSLVDNGTITASEGQTVDREIEAGRIDTDSLVSAGFTQAQLQAVQQALGSTKRGLAAAAHGTSK